MSPPTPTVNVYEEIPIDIPENALQSMLSYFGLHETFDKSGSRHWTIAIERDASGGLQQEAFFESSTRSWRLRHKYTATNVMRGPAAPISEPSTPAAAIDSRELALSVTNSSDGFEQPSPFEMASWVTTLPNIPHSDFFRSIDWAQTELGNLSDWPTSLRFYTHMVLSQQTPAAVYWGSRYIAIYNEGFIPLLGNAHPRFMGSPFMDVWPDLRTSFGAIFDQIQSTGLGIDLSDYNLFLDRSGYLEETWWRGNLFPLAQEDGSIGGCCFMWNEVTRQVLSDRRTKLLNDMGRFDMSVDSVWKHIRTTLRRNPRDIAMATLYSCEDGDTKQDRILHKEGAIGIGTNHVAAPDELNLDKTNDGFAPIMRKALNDPAGWIAVERDQENFSREVLKGIDWQGYGEQSNDIIVIPLVLVNKLLKGFVILGMNPRRAFDADHRQFVSDMRRQLITIMTSVTTYEQAKLRESKLMQDLAESERRIRHLAELAPMGLFDLSTEGRMLWANNHYFSIMGIDRPHDISDTPWIEPVDPSDLERVETLFKSCIENDKELSGTVRLKRAWQAPRTELGEEPESANKVHVYFQAFTYKENGSTNSIMGSVTDVSRFVWAESVQARSAENALRARQRQEEFIDIVSHELRNPLSAVTQCADSVIQSLREFCTGKEDTETQLMVESCVDAADSILLCAAHQKRIVDDVLTLSKLDSDLITIAPTQFQPIAIKKEVMQMFQSEFLANDINVSVESKSSQISVSEPLVCDPARVSQVLVNLVTNAIKFQKADGEHRIDIRYGVTHQAPVEAAFGHHFQWSRSKTIRDADVTSGYDNSATEDVYLYFSVQDNGQGLPRNKAVQIFDKFIQASRRTHVKYGGSGLGLYISRQLTEMQGGHIGVESEDGVGSTFAFFVKAKRIAVTTPPAVSSPSKNPINPTSSHDNITTSTPNTSTRNLPTRPPLPHSSISNNNSVINNTTTPTASSSSSIPKAAFEILLVEDNLVNQKVLAKQLRKAGCTVHVANHGGEAVDFILSTHGQPTEYGTTLAVTSPALHPVPVSVSTTTTATTATSTSKQPPPPPPPPPSSESQKYNLDCILMDWEMPVLDGLAATSKIRSLESTGILPSRQIILGVTANARREQIDLALTAGMDAVVTKPFRVVEVTDKIGELIAAATHQDKDR